MPSKNGTWSATYKDYIVLEWNQRRHRKTILINPNSSVGMFHTAPSINTFLAHCACNKAESLLAMSSTIDLTDPEDILATAPDAPSEVTEAPPPDRPLDPSQDKVDLELTDKIPMHPTFEDLSTEMLHWHYRLGHMPFPRLRQLAKLGIIPKELFYAAIPICSSTRRYLVATVFVDHMSGLDYPFLQQSTSSAETVAAKESFELYASSFGVMIRHYHCDNGRFADNMFRDSVARSHQTISYSGVGQHNQNGKAEKRIRDLQDAARTMLLHAERQWPSAINTHLWPYALRMASDVYNSAPRLDQDAAPVELFTGAKMRPLVNRFHHFGCPTFVLLSDLQSGKKGRKWSNRARVGIYLGRSTQHARSISLILSLDTGLVSPQFHCSFDNMFETTRAPQAHMNDRTEPGARRDVLRGTSWRTTTWLTSPSPKTNPLPPNPSTHWQ
mmetsp:Transcript_8113/g.11817  ORF Transcript_8113/g.11817 Transcript_8113/m.11817 type:complete len:442 (+) Transcript_8113:3455-4780(+)